MNTEHDGLICWGISQCDPVFQCFKHISIRDSILREVRILPVGCISFIYILSVGGGHEHLGH